MSHVLTFGKYKGDTLGMVRSNDLEYIIWLSEQEPTHQKALEAVKACQACIEYLRETDPYSIEKWRH